MEDTDLMLLLVGLDHLLANGIECLDRYWYHVSQLGIDLDRLKISEHRQNVLEQLSMRIKTREGAS